MVSNPQTPMEPVTCEDHDAVDCPTCAVGAAAVAVEMALDARQSVDNADRLAVAAWFAEVAAKQTALAAAEARLRRAESPSWDVLLADPTQQFDPASAVMRSIEEYRNATKGTIEIRQVDRDLPACEAMVPAYHDDDRRLPCGHEAEVEALWIDGRWHPHCRRHTDGYPPNRLRPLGGAE